MSLAIKDSDSSSHFDSAGPVSVDVEDKTGNPNSETLLRTMLLNFPSYIYYWLLTTFFHHNQLDEDSRDVERGEIMQAEAIGIEYHAESSNAHIQLVETTMGNQTVTESYSLWRSGVDEGEVQAQDAEPQLDIITENQTLFEESRVEEVILARDVELELESNTTDQTMLEFCCFDYMGTTVTNNVDTGIIKKRTRKRTGKRCGSLMDTPNWTCAIGLITNL